MATCQTDLSIKFQTPSLASLRLASWNWEVYAVVGYLDCFLREGLGKRAPFSLAYRRVKRPLYSGTGVLPTLLSTYRAHKSVIQEAPLGIEY